jgi:hypothetical protein
MKHEHRPICRLDYHEISVLLDACDWLIEGPENERAMEALKHRDRVRALSARGSR